MKCEVYCFRFSLLIHLMIWGCSFLPVALARRLRRCAEATVNLKKNTEGNPGDDQDFSFCCIESNKNSTPLPPPPPEVGSSGNCFIRIDISSFYSGMVDWEERRMNSIGKGKLNGFSWPKQRLFYWRLCKYLCFSKTGFTWSSRLFFLFHVVIKS